MNAFFYYFYNMMGHIFGLLWNIILSIKSISNADLYNSNKTTFLKIVEGENYTRLDRSKKDFYLQLFDFEHPENNIFKVCNQVIIKGNQKRDKES